MLLESSNAILLLETKMVRGTGKEPVKRSARDRTQKGSKSAASDLIARRGHLRGWVKGSPAAVKPDSAPAGVYHRAGLRPDPLARASPRLREGKLFS
jgi:hypothetical protein